jgi:hypothetical protein
MNNNIKGVIPVDDYISRVVFRYVTLIVIMCTVFMSFFTAAPSPGGGFAGGTVHFGYGCTHVFFNFWQPIGEESCGKLP